MHGIIVGVDDSGHSHYALRWAMHEAALRHAPLTVMTVCPSPARPATMSFWGLPTLPGGGFDREHARRAVQEAVDKAAREISGAPPEVAVTVAMGEPTEELVAAARDADMLVVGSRGSGGFAKLLLGSVSSQVVHHASCPVVVIPAAR
ncbi:MAG TPA: universal stress protein [Streptosporangiaceae bacterium]|jgi:nucleotide-binding universal stress UspA family protein